MKRSDLGRLAGWSALLVMALVAGGCGPRQPAAFSFMVAADMRDYAPPEHAGPQYFAGACAAMREVGPGAFVIMPGDYDPPDRVRATLDAELSSDYVWYPVIGNHELDKPEYMTWLREYNAGGRKLPNIVRSGPPGAVETCYSFDYGNAHFVALNQYYDGKTDSAGGGGDISPALYDWLAEDLAANTKPLVFVFGHEPTVVVPDMDNGRLRHLGKSLDKHPENNHRFWTLLRQHNVTAFCCGHDHNASIAQINGLWQLDCGHARGIGDPGAWSTFLKIDVEVRRVRCTVYRNNGENGTYRPTYAVTLR